MAVFVICLSLGSDRGVIFSYYFSNEVGIFSVAFTGLMKCDTVERLIWSVSTLFVILLAVFQTHQQVVNWTYSKYWTSMGRT